MGKDLALLGGFTDYAVDRLDGGGGIDNEVSFRWIIEQDV